MINTLKQEICIIVAIDKNNLIGRNNHLPWKLKEDLEHFRKITMGHPVVMGRNTWQSLGRPLDGRINIILTNDKEFNIPGCIVLHSIDEVLTSFHQQKIFVIGGAQVFKQFLPYTNTIYLTRINAEYIGDVFFPEVNWKEWTLIEYSHITSSEGIELSFEEWKRN